MKKSDIILVLLLFSFNLAFSQSKMVMGWLLDGVAKTEYSKDITKTFYAKKIISYGEKSLPILLDFFMDTTSTKVYSECRARNLIKGELAIIIADRIHRMPYMKLTGLQNCLSTFCEDNPNLIEYYLYVINREGLSSFQTKYKEWLAYQKLSAKEKRKVEKISNRVYRKQVRNHNRVLKINSR